MCCCFGLSEKNCIFCNILKGTHPQRIIFEDSQVFAFEDIQLGSAQRHILICPKRHIKNINKLTAADISLLNRLEEVGVSILSKSHPNSTYRFGYHSPPFYSIPHLHLHGLVLPITSFLNNHIKYGCGLTSTQSLIRKLSTSLHQQGNTEDL